MQGIVLPHIFNLQSLALFVEQTQKPRYESGCDSPTSSVQSSDELAEHELTLRKQKITKHTLNTGNNNRFLAALIPHLQDVT